MKIDVTDLVKLDCSQFSASRYELGDDAARITWLHARERAAAHPLVAEDQLDKLRAHFAEYGAWTWEQLSAMTLTELNAMLIQCVARENLELGQWCDAGEDGRLYQGDNNRWYFYVGI